MVVIGLFEGLHDADIQEHPSVKGMYIYKMYGKFDDVSATEFLSVQLDMSEFRLTWDNSTAQCFVLGKFHPYLLGYLFLEDDPRWSTMDPEL